jgi:ABC-type multidrug transport system permease subunit
MVFSGMTGLPSRLLPAPLQIASQILPATHGMNAFRGIAQDLQADFSPAGSLIVLVAGGLLAFFMAVYLFTWDRHNAARGRHPLFGLAALMPYVAGMFLLS